MSKWSQLWALPMAQRAPALLAARFTPALPGSAKSARRSAARRARKAAP